MTERTNRTNDWIDPRPTVSAGRLAERGPSRGRRLVFADNGKIAPSNSAWGPVEREVVAAMAELGDVIVERYDLLQAAGSGPQFRATTVTHWSTQGIDGVVVGLCDAGTTTPSIALAAAAEMAGIPVVVLCTDIVAHLGTVQAHFLIEGLQLMVVPVSRLDDPDTIATHTRSITPRIVEGLTLPAEDLVAAAHSDFPFATGLGRSDSTDDFQAIAARDRMTDGLPDGLLGTPTCTRCSTRPLN